MKYEMQEVQLSILQCGGQNSATIIQSVWEKILNNEFEKIRENSRLTPLIDKLVSLGKKFIMTDYFPFSKKHNNKKQKQTNILTFSLLSLRFHCQQIGKIFIRFGRSCSRLEFNRCT